MSQEILTLLFSYLIGSLPIGGYLLIWQGFKPKDISAHNLGLENFVRLVGRPLAISLLLIDVLKSCLALAIFASPWAILGVYIGHLYPLNIFTKDNYLRARGNGILLGLLIILPSLGYVSLTVAIATFFAFVFTLIMTRYTTLATLISLLTLILLSNKQQSELLVVWGLVFLLCLWRHKASFMRIVDGLEPRLGDPPPVHNVTSKVIYTAFMIHPMTKEDWWQPKSLSWLKPFLQNLPTGLLNYWVLFMRPNKYGEITGVRLKDGREIRVILIGAPLLPEHIRKHPKIATRVAIQGARLAKALGAEALGLGAFWSTVGNKGQEVQEAVPDIPITNGGAYTAATVKATVPMLLTRYKLQGKSLKKSTVAIVGANGVVAFGIARLIAAEFGKLILIGRDEGRLKRSAKTLTSKYPNTFFEISTNINAGREADLIFSATSDPEAIIFAENVKQGAYIFDLGRPADVHESVKAIASEVIPGGMVKPPGDMKQSLNLHFGGNVVPACLAETMIMAASKSFERRSLGTQTKMENLNFYLQEGSDLGFEVITGVNQGIALVAA